LVCRVYEQPRQPSIGTSRKNARGAVGSQLDVPSQPPAVVAAVESAYTFRLAQTEPSETPGEGPMTLKRIVVPILAALAATAALAAKDDERIAALEQRIATLEAQLAAVEQQVDAKLDACVEAAVREIGNREQNARQAFQSIAALAGQGNQVQAKTEMTAFLEKYSGTEAAKQAARLNEELQVVGKPAPAQLDVEKWFTGDASSVDLATGGTSLIVFWEEWCPHCKREVPKLKDTYAKYGDDGLRILALTRITKTSTDAAVTQFIAANGLDFPIAKERGDLSAYFGVSGIPAAAVVKDGQIIWRGHPGVLTDAMIEGWLASSAASAAAGG
jgi:thiol-disulfide isomerase/thioredoxin